MRSENKKLLQKSKTITQHKIYRKTKHYFIYKISYYKTSQKTISQAKKVSCCAGKSSTSLLYSKTKKMKQSFIQKIT